MLDPFVGSGTTLISARDLNRNAIGVDINSAYTNLCEQRFAQLTLEDDSTQIAVTGDA